MPVKNGVYRHWNCHSYSVMEESIKLEDGEIIEGFLSAILKY